MILKLFICEVNAATGEERRAEIESSEDRREEGGEEEGEDGRGQKEGEWERQSRRGNRGRRGEMRREVARGGRSTKVVQRNSVQSIRNQRYPRLQWMRLGHLLDDYCRETVRS
jgi:hypothetical protein